MGGLVFANTTTESGKPVNTPRLPSALYKQVAAECQVLLETMFERVVIPREAPAKVDHGDIDYLVGGIKIDLTASDNIWKRLKQLLGTNIDVHRGGSHSYAIPHPEDPHAFVQVDVELAPGNGTPDAPELFNWTRFMKGDSDLLQILGASHRSLGLTCNDKGLHIRVEEIEPYDAKKAMLFLTRNPDQFMAFYGLDSTKYWAGFKDETELFDWATSGRFFYPEKYERLVQTSNDRSRYDKRPMYKRFVAEYMPAHTDRGASNDWARKQVLEEALKTFDKEAEYDTMIEQHEFKHAEEALWEEVKAVLPNSNSRKDAVKGLRRWVVFEYGKPQIAATPTLDDQSVWTKLMAPDSKEELLAWVKENYEKAKALEKERAKKAREAALSP